MFVFAAVPVFGIFNVRTGVDARDCIEGYTNTTRVSALNIDWNKNPLLHKGTEPASALPMSCRALARVSGLC